MSDALPLALAIALSPFPIVPAILLLFTPRARATSAAFLLGWMTGIAAATTVFVLVADLLEASDATPTWVSWARLLLGAVLVVLGVRQWFSRGTSGTEPAWMRSLADAGPASAVRLGLLLSVANPKIVLLAAAGGLSLGALDSTPLAEAVGVMVFTLVAASTVMAPVLLYAVLGDRVLGPLGVARDWLVTHNAAVMSVVITVIGLVLVVKGVKGL